MFWDSSALIPILLPERRSAALTEAMAADREVTLWWGTPVECLSAIYRRHRECPLPAALLTEALNRLRALVEDADTVSPTDEVRRRAGRLVAAHPLRAADALQLGAALSGWAATRRPARRLSSSVGDTVSASSTSARSRFNASVRRGAGTGESRCRR